MPRAPWDDGAGARGSKQHPLATAACMPTPFTFPLAYAAFSAAAAALRLQPLPAAATRPLVAASATASTVGAAVTATTLTVALGSAAAAPHARIRRTFLLIAASHAAILTYVALHAAGLDTHYADVRGRPLSLARSVAWTHSLSLFLAALLQLSPAAPARKAQLVGESVLIALLAPPTFLARAPWRHVAFAAIAAMTLRMYAWVHALLRAVVRELRGRVRHPRLLGVFTALSYASLLLETAYFQVRRPVEASILRGSVRQLVHAQGSTRTRAPASRSSSPGRSCSASTLRGSGRRTSRWTSWPRCCCPSSWRRSSARRSSRPGSAARRRAGRCVAVACGAQWQVAACGI